MKRKLLAVLVTVFVFLTVLTVSASATTQNGWVVIDGYYHYFDSEGYEYTGDEYWFEEYDAYFRFDEEGRMLTNQWFWNEYDECWQFYKAGGYRADNEILNIGGYLYAFDHYSMVEGYAEIYDDATEEWKYVYATDGGVLYSGWLQDDEGYWYYFLPDGYMATNQVVKVGNYYYAFNWSGQMYTESSDIYDYDSETWRYFRTRADGTLYTGWYKDENGCWFYYGDNGLAPGYGLTYVGGVPYFFWSDGEMVTDNVLYDEVKEVTCYVDKNGYVTVFNNNGWTYAGNEWYYCVDGEFASSEILNIGGTYYYFFYDGTMLANDYICADLYDDEGNYIGECYIRAKASGALYVNEWCLDAYGDWYYYGEGGHAASGLTYVGETLYNFYHDGQMKTNYTAYDGEYTYYSNDVGVTTALNYNGWTSVMVAGEERFFYCVDGAYLYDQIAEIDGKVYYFDDCFMATNSTIWAENPYADYEYTYVRAGASGALLCGEWYQRADGSFMYFGYDYAAADGEICVINGNEYLFNYGSVLAQNAYVEVYDEDNGWAYYITNASGVVVRTPGWYACGENYYYINEDATLYTGDLWYGDKLYKMQPEMEYAYVSYTYDENGCWLYCTLPDGSLQWITVDGLYTDDYSTYYVEGGKLYHGWKQINGSWYYFEPSMYVNGVYRVWDENYENSTYHYFDAQGKMLTNTWIRDYNYDGYGTYFYADENGYLANGLVWIGNNYYYFGNYSLRYNILYYHNDETYFVDNNGIATPIAENDGWLLVGSDWYYIDDGYLVTSDWWYIDDYCYGFDNTGKMIVDTYVDGWNFYFDENGHRYEGWRLEDGKWAYYQPSKFYDGMCYIDEKNYYFEDGYLVYNKTVDLIWDCIRIVVGADGTVVSTTPIENDWIYKYGDLYYFTDGQLFGGWYGNNFFENGRMVINERIFHAGNQYYFDTKGNLVRGWYEDPYNGNWVYADANGVLVVDDWALIGNTWYYFDDCWMQADGVCYIPAEDAYAEFDKNGAFIGYVTYGEDDLVYGTPGWSKNAKGKWNYFNSASVRVENQELYLGNSWYYFDDDGVMLANKFYEGKYYTASGARLMATSEWKLINNEWCYFNAEGRAVSGWVNINGVDYFIRNYYTLYDKNGKVTEDYDEAVDYTVHYAMVTGYYMIDWNVYYFDSYGACQGEYTGNGWLQLANGEFVYFKDGVMIDFGVFNIGGKMYAFGDGILLTGEDALDYGYYTDKNGVVYAPGWYKTKQGWIYVQEDYSMCYSGVYNIGGVVYYFCNGYMI